MTAQSTLVRNLEKSKRFLTPRLVAESAETSGSGSNQMQQQASVGSRVNFDIVADYNPLPIKLTAKAKEKASDDDADSDSTPGTAPDTATHKPAPKTKHHHAKASRNRQRRCPVKITRENLFTFLNLHLFLVAVLAITQPRAAHAPRPCLAHAPH